CIQGQIRLDKQPFPGGDAAGARRATGGFRQIAADRRARWRAAPPGDASLSIIGFEDEMTWSRPGSGDRREPRASSRHLWHLSELIGDKDQAMEIEGTTSGTITIDGKTYEHAVIIG